MVDDHRDGLTCNRNERAWLPVHYMENGKTMGGRLVKKMPMVPAIAAVMASVSHAHPDPLGVYTASL